MSKVTKTRWNSWNKKTRWYSVWLSFLLCLPVLTVAQIDEPSVASSIATAKPADVRVLIDVSGSMKQNDPDNLRQPALELLVNLLPEDSKAGVWTFGRYINMLVPHRPVTGRWREDAKSKAAEINSVGLFTNIGEALEKAAYDADKPNDRYQTSLILLTDGMVDIDKDPDANQEEWRRIVDEVLPKLKQAGYTIHTIALSDNADTALLNKLALATDGMSEVAKNADELMKIFLRAFDQAAPAEQVPLEGNSFLVDSSIEEFTALIFRKPGSEPTVLVSPDDTRYEFDNEQEDVNWYRTDVYDLITVKRPLEGEWQALADIDPDSRVTIVSNLNLLVKPLPSNVFMGETVDLSLLLQDKGATITNQDFLGLLSVMNRVGHDLSGEQWEQNLSIDGTPSDGIYRSQLDMLQQEGRFELTLSVDGKSFQRQFRHQISVRVPFETGAEKKILGGREQYRVSVKAHSQVVDHENTQVVARIRDPKGRSAIKPLQLTPTDEWELMLQPEHEGTYSIRLRISGTDTTGVNFDVDPDPINFTYPDTDPFGQPMAADLEETVEEVVEEPLEQAAPEPVVVAEPEPVEPALVVVQPEQEEAEESSRWPLYVALGVGNLLIMVLAFFAYRTIMGSGSGGSLKDLEESVAKSENMDAEAPVESAEPVMDEIKPIEQDLAVDQAQDDADLAAQLAADLDLGGGDAAATQDDGGLDLSSDEVTDAEIPSLSEELSGDDLMASLDEAGGAEAAEGDEDAAAPDDGGLEGFSLDDFAPEDLDDLTDDDEAKKDG